MNGSKAVGLKIYLENNGGRNMSNQQNKKYFWWINFIIYMSILIYKVFIKAYGNYYRTPMKTRDYNLTLFKSIDRFTRAFNHYSFEVYFYNIYGNILAFMPIGFLLPMIYKKIKFWNITIIGFLISLIIEITQYISYLGTFDVDDLLLNTIGVAIGYGINKLTITAANKYKNKFNLKAEKSTSS